MSLANVQVTILAIGKASCLEAFVQMLLDSLDEVSRVKLHQVLYLVVLGQNALGVFYLHGAVVLVLLEGLLLLFLNQFLDILISLPELFLQFMKATVDFSVEVCLAHLPCCRYLVL